MKKLIIIISLIIIITVFFYSNLDNNQKSINPDNLTTEIQNIHKEIEDLLIADKDELDIVKLLLKRFDKSETEIERALYSFMLGIYGTPLELNKNKFKKLSSHEQDLYSESKKLVKIYIDLNNRFEKELDPEEIEYVTQDNPDSIYYKLKTFNTDIVSNKCQKENLSALVLEIGAEKLKQRASTLSQLAKDYERLYLADYLDRKLELLKQDDKFDKYKPGLVVYFTIQSYSRIKRQDKITRDLEQRINKNSKKLIKTGVSETDMQSYVNRITGLAPECLVGLNVQIYNWIGDEVTKERGLKILDQIKNKIDAHKRLKKEIVKLMQGPIGKAIPMRLKSKEFSFKPLDAWSRNFYLKKIDTATYLLYSLGKNKRNSLDNVFVKEFLITTILGD